MKDKEKQNSNSNLVNLINDLWDCQDENINGIALELLKKGYRKIPEDRVVISNEEYEKVVNYLKEYEDKLRNFPNEINALVDMYNKGITETAEKILSKGKEFYNSREDKGIAFNLFAMWIENEFGVEIKE